MELAELRSDQSHSLSMKHDRQGIMKDHIVCLWSMLCKKYNEDFLRQTCFAIWVKLAVDVLEDLDSSHKGGEKVKTTSRQNIRSLFLHWKVFLIVMVMY